MVAVDGAIVAGVVMVAVIIVVLVFPKLILAFKEFSFALRYLNSEIQNTSGPQRDFWKRERNRLFLSLIPFARY